MPAPDSASTAKDEWLIGRLLSSCFFQPDPKAEPRYFFLFFSLFGFVLPPSAPFFLARLLTEDWKLTRILAELRFCPISLCTPAAGVADSSKETHRVWKVPETNSAGTSDNLCCLTLCRSCLAQSSAEAYVPGHRICLCYAHIYYNDSCGRKASRLS